MLKLLSDFDKNVNVNNFKDVLVMHHFQLFLREKNLLPI